MEEEAALRIVERPRAQRAPQSAEVRAGRGGGIPLCLLVDREASSVTLFSDPEKDEYRERCTRPFGKPITLPAPFAFDLDTADFL